MPGQQYLHSRLAVLLPFKMLDPEATVTNEAAYNTNPHVLTKLIKDSVSHTRAGNIVKYMHVHG